MIIIRKDQLATSYFPRNINFILDNEVEYELNVKPPKGKDGR